jgi:Kef-type K+ transport system membrane component KefB
MVRAGTTRGRRNAYRTQKLELRDDLTDFPILRDLGLILFTAALLVVSLRRIRVPAIVAYMAAGLLLGPLTGIMKVTESVHLISETGVALLLFLVGLELSLDHIRGVARVAIPAGLIQIVATALVGAVIAVFAGFPPLAAAVIALSVTFSSTVVVVKLLAQKRQLDELFGHIAVAILLVQDAVVIIVMTLFAGLASTGDSSSWQSLGIAVARAFGGMLLLALIATVAARYILPRVFSWVESSADTAFIWSLAWCFLMIIAAETVHLSVELGAFIAGVGLAQLSYVETLRRRVQPIVNFFLAVFFVSLGLQMDPVAALAKWPIIVALAAAVLIIKPLILLAVIPRFRYGARTSFMTALTLGQMSEFSFILGGMALAAGAMDVATLSVVTLTGFVTIAISSFMILSAERLYASRPARALLRAVRAGSQNEPTGATELHGHVIVAGMNTLGLALVQQLAERGEDVVAIDTDATKLAGLPARTILGSTDDRAVLEQATYLNAKLVISALQIEGSNSLLAYRCRLHGVRCAIHAFDPSLVDELREIGVDHIMIPKNDGARRMAVLLREAGVFD